MEVAGIELLSKHVTKSILKLDDLLFIPSTLPSSANFMLDHSFEHGGMEFEQGGGMYKRNADLGSRK